MSLPGLGPIQSPPRWLTTLPILTLAVLVVLDAADLCLSEETPRVDALHATLALDGSELSILHLAARSDAAPSPAGASLARFDASGRLSIDAPFDDADLEALLFAAGLPA